MQMNAAECVERPERAGAAKERCMRSCQRGSGTVSQLAACSALNPVCKHPASQCSLVQALAAATGGDPTAPAPPAPRTAVGAA